MSMEPPPPLDRELLDLPEEMRWREWMMRVEAVVFASPKPVPRQILAQLIGAGVAVDTVIEAIQKELRARPYELVYVAGGWQHRTRERYGPMLRTALASPVDPVAALTRREIELLAVIAFQQPVTRGQCEEILGRAVTGDEVGRLRAAGVITTGHRKPGPGAPHTLITTDRFLEYFELGSLADLDALEDSQDEAG